MKRKIALLLGSFVTLLVLFLVYNHNQASPSEGFRTSHRRKLAPRPSPVAGENVEMLSSGTGLKLHKRDKSGRLEAIIHLPKWDKQPDGSYDVQDPEFTIFHKDGERTHVTSQRGSLVLEDISRGVNMRSGSLTGDVRIWVDLETDFGVTRPPMSERLHQIVRIHADHLHFDNDALRVHSDSQVTLLSARADIYGKGLDLRWRESPRELLWLEIKQGSYMAIYDMPNMDSALPGGPSKDSANSPDSSADTHATSGSSSTHLANAPIPPATSVKDQPRNIYKAVFRDGVRVDFPDSREDRSKDAYLDGASMLSLAFEWGNTDSTSRRSFVDSPRPGPSGTVVDESGDAVATQHNTGHTDDHLDSTTRPAPQQDDEPEESRPVIITWNGPLVLEPTGYTPKTSSDRYTIEAIGPRLTLSDGQMIATGESLMYQSPQQHGHLNGGDQARAGLMMEDGQQAFADKITFDRQNGKAHLQGPGFMVRKERNDQSPPLETEILNDQLNDRNEHIHWSQYVDLTFASDDAGESLTDAMFVGDVVLVSAADATTGLQDKVSCDKLDVVMTRNSKAQTVPQVATARGKVTAWQQGGEIQADKMVVTFREVAGDPQAAEETATPTGRFRPVAIEAFDNVIVKGDSEDEPMEAHADRLLSNLIDRSAVLYGKPARIAQGDSSMTGERIDLYEIPLEGGSQHKANVSGEGSIHLLATRDLSGGEISKPRPVVITWSRSMRYDGSANSVTFTGDVQLDGEARDDTGLLGLDHMTCRTMHLTLEPIEPNPDKPRKQTNEPKGLLGTDNFGKRRITKIVAQDDVKMMSSRVDDQDRIVRRLNVTGSELIHEADVNRTDVFGKGTMLAEDYSAPKDRADNQDLQSPFRAAFWWDKVMTLTRTPSGQTSAVLDGNASLVYHSGMHVDRGNMNLPEWGQMTSGRITKLRGDVLSASFAPSDNDSRDGDTPRVGALERFLAAGDVLLEDGLHQKRTIACQKLDYDNRNNIDMITADGSLPGKPSADAVLTHRDLRTYRRNETKAPRIIWYRKTDRIEVRRIKTVGGN